MKKKYRKLKPQPPPWAWLKGEDCWNCPNKNGCGNCKQAKILVADQREKNERKLKLHKGVIGIGNF